MDTTKPTKNCATVQKVQSVCSKPYKFIRDDPTSSAFDMSFEKIQFTEEQTKFEDLYVPNQFDFLVKYTAMLCKVIKIDGKVHVLGNHGAQVWADRGVDTYIPWQVNMTCPFNTHNKKDKQITFITMPKEVYEDRYSFLANWYLYYIHLGFHQVDTQELSLTLHISQSRLYRNIRTSMGLYKNLLSQVTFVILRDVYFGITVVLPVSYF